jgi:multiple RNA-binding domain-containing protein 1
MIIFSFSQPINSTKRKRQIEKEQQTSKILVKNIPFQANLKELRELFRVFGELKFVRMPKKVDDEHHRGFGFVDFVSKNDAKVRTIEIGFNTKNEFDLECL